MTRKDDHYFAHAWHSDDGRRDERRQGNPDRRAGRETYDPDPRDSRSFARGPALHPEDEASTYDGRHVLRRDDNRRLGRSKSYDRHPDREFGTGTGYGGYGDAPGEGAAGFDSGHNYAAEPGWGPGYGRADPPGAGWGRTGYPDAGRSRSFGRPSVDDRGRAASGHSDAMPGAARPPGRLLRGPKDYRRSDERIRDDICERLMHRGEHIDASEVSVDVKDGVVTLQGAVPERRMKHAIEDIVDDCMGVSDIDNRIRVTYGEHHAVHASQEPHREAPSISIGSAGGPGSAGGA